MDIKDINIRNLQTENVRLRNLLADKDALAKSSEHEKEEWTKEARVGDLSLEEHFSDMEDFRKENEGVAISPATAASNNWLNISGTKLPVEGTMPLPPSSSE